MIADLEIVKSRKLCGKVGLTEGDEVCLVAKTVKLEAKTERLVLAEVGLETLRTIYRGKNSAGWAERRVRLLPGLPAASRFLLRLLSVFILFWQPLPPGWFGAIFWPARWERRRVIRGRFRLSGLARFTGRWFLGEHETGKVELRVFLKKPCTLG